MSGHGSGLQRHQLLITVEPAVPEVNETPEREYEHEYVLARGEEAALIHVNDAKEMLCSSQSRCVSRRGRRNCRNCWDA